MSDLMYRSTRRVDDVVTASRAVLNGLSADGGLYVPESIPQLPRTMGEFAKMDYRETAFEILKCFLTDYTDEELRHCVEGAYDAKFDDERIVPVTGTGDDYYLELYHGPTIAFKDMALSILPYLMTIAAKKQGIDREIVILTATSGDTGKAALAGFADVPGTKIIVFYPKDGVSPIQKLQMVTQKGANTCVIGVDGNFDDCQ
ncbi:MAG: threonine synthase, partial [Lachnospiraceae bacterium]|nr:threonine synthase [Lachnospiraceae bacterium]